MLLDGDNVRHGLNRDLGFTEADRVENIRRVGEVAKLMVEGGLIVLCSFISPYRAERDMVRGLVAAGEFIEVFVDTPIEDCMRRDPKGLYAKAQCRQDQELHRHRCALRGPAAAGDPPAHARPPARRARRRGACHVGGARGCHVGIIRLPLLVIAGLVPAIPIREAQSCLPKQDGRHKAGHDELIGSASYRPTSSNNNLASVSG